MKKFTETTYERVVRNATATVDAFNYVRLTSTRDNNDIYLAVYNNSEDLAEEVNSVFYLWISERYLNVRGDYSILPNYVLDCLKQLVEDLKILEPCIFDFYKSFSEEILEKYYFHDYNEKIFKYHKLVDTANHYYEYIDNYRC